MALRDKVDFPVQDLGITLTASVLVALGVWLFNRYPKHRFLRWIALSLTLIVALSFLILFGFDFYNDASDPFYQALYMQHWYPAYKWRHIALGFLPIVVGCLSFRYTSRK